jgi:chromosome segregation ATPase
MTSQDRSRFDAALRATYETIKFIAQGWQRHEDAIGELSRAKEATEVELTKIHDEIAECRKTVSALLKPVAKQDTTLEQVPTEPQTASVRRELPDKRRRLLEQSAHLWKVIPKRNEDASPPET